MKNFSSQVLAKLQERDQRGATAVEYGLMVALIGVALLATLIILGGKMNAMFTMIAGLL